MTEPADLIEDYLEDLRHGAHRRRNAARLVDDAEEHLRDAQQAFIDRGLDPASAAAAAIAEFGDVGDIVAASPRAGGPLAPQVARASMPFVAAGLVGVGVAGLLGTAIASVVGADRVAAFAAVQLALGFVGLSMIEARRRRVASGADLSTPGIVPSVVSTTAVLVLAIASAMLFVAATTLLLSGHHDYSASAWLVALGLAASSTWIALGTRARALLHRRSPAAA